MRRAVLLILLLPAVVLALLPACGDEGEEGATPPPAPATSPAAETPAPTLTRYEIDQAKHPEAVSNDGSTPVFYFRRGVGDGANKWVIFFKFGGSCYSEETCKDRERNLLSTEPWREPERSFDGIFSPEPQRNPDFYRWNHVYMVYTTSDEWSGTVPASRETGNLHFRGHFVVDAIIDALQDPNIVGTPNLKDATQVLFAGASAGAGGLRNNIDRLAAQLTWADVRAVSDASISPTVNPEAVPFITEVGRQRWELWRPIIDESCLASLHTGTVPWTCMEGEYLLANEHISTPIFFRMDQLDPLPLEAQQLDPRDPNDAALIDEFAAQVRALLRRDSVTGAFSTRARRHIVLTDAEFYAQELDGYSMAEVLANWYFDRPGPKKVIEQP